YILDLKLDTRFEQSKIELDYKNILSYESQILNIEKDVLKIHKQINFFKNELKKIEDLKHKLEFLVSINLRFNIKVFNNFYFIEMIYGRLSKLNAVRFKELFSNDMDTLFHELKIEENQSYFLVVYLKSRKEKFINILNSLYFEILDIPSDIADKPSWIISKLQGDIELINCDLEKYSLEKKYNNILFRDIIKKIYNSLAANVIINEIAERSGKFNKNVMINGWVPEDYDSKFSYHINKISENSALFFSKPAEKYFENKSGSVNVPTLIENPKFFKPFEDILKMYGIPSYFEYDPTKIVAVSFLIMFGLMFGDVGQGFIIFLAGFIIYKKNKINAFKIMQYMGISSIIFGLLYGEYFGFELFKPLWLSPVHSTDHFMIITVLIGICIISIGIILNIINCDKNKDHENKYFGKNGVAGIVFYWGTLAAGLFLVLKIIDFGINFITCITILLIWVIPLMIMMLKEPLSHYISHNKFFIKEDKANYIVLSVIELFDVVLSFLSNSISFVRIAAFALNHVGLFAVVKIIADIINVGRYDRDLDILIYILGNVLIIVVESVIVTIQILRLEYYEFFSKFYKGDGVSFNPDKLEVDNKITA
nr:hypothetical protein [Candidatus Dependentiae bacterium]